MARKRQSKSLQQRVKQLVAEGNPTAAYYLLSEDGWIPEGSGHQINLPLNLTVYAKIDETRRILVAPGGRYWAWEQLGSGDDRFKALTQLAEEVKGMSLPEIADEVYGLGGMIYMINHDAADGRLEGDVDKDLSSIRQAIQVAKLEFAKKAGLDPLDQRLMKKRMEEEHGKYTALMVARWQQIFTLGTVFKMTAKGYEKYANERYETIGAYNRQEDAILIDDQTILAVLLGTNEIHTFRDNDVSRLRLIPVEAESQHLNDPRILRSRGGGKFSAFINEKPAWELQAVFEFSRHDPRKGTWETFDTFGIPGRRGEGVIVACSRYGNTIAEFTADDQVFMKMLDAKQINVVKGGTRNLHF